MAEQTMTFTETVSVGLVLVPVVVRSRGRYVNDLEEADFELRVDGEPVAIESFEPRGEAPVSVVLLQDLSGSMGTAGALEASQRAAYFLLNNTRHEDEIALVSFADGSTLVDVPFTTDREVVAEAIGAWEAYGTTALHDAVAWLPEVSSEGRHLKRAAILLTDGVDNASRISPTEARSLVRRSELPVYVLGFRSGDPYSLQRDGEKVHRYADVLNLLARFTGGEYHALDEADDTVGVLQKITAELHHQYVLGFATSGLGDYRPRKIEVLVRGKNFQVSARQGYEGTAPATGN